MKARTITIVAICFLLCAILSCGNTYSEENNKPTEPQPMIMSQGTPDGEERVSSAVDIMNYLESSSGQTGTIDITDGNIYINGSLSLPENTVINTTGTITINNSGLLTTNNGIANSTTGTININGGGSLPIINSSNQGTGSTITMIATQTVTSQQLGSFPASATQPTQQITTGSTLNVKSSTTVSTATKVVNAMKNLKSKIKDFASTISDKFANITAPKMRNIKKPRTR